MVHQSNQDLKILVIDDDPTFQSEVVNLLGIYNDIIAVGTIEEARKSLLEHSFDVILLDKQLPDGNGLHLIPVIRENLRNGVIIVITGYDDLKLLQKCIDAGANDYLLKTPNIISDLLIRIPIAIRQSNERRRSVHLEERLKAAFKFELIGHSAATSQLREEIQRLKGSLSTVLITGESGTGKELVARRINAIEDRNRVFIGLNCAAIPETLIESELFGHMKGSFSGAVQNQIGKFELANGGDLFLDEIGELSLPAQAKLLRALQEGEILPLGAKKPVPVSVRIIAATNRSLEELMNEGKFRSDLYYRVNVYRIHTPTLRERPEDIGDLARYFISNSEFAGASWEISVDAIKYLERYPWPGNIRELRNLIERAVISARARGSKCLDKSDFSVKISSGQNVNKGTGFPTLLPKSPTDVSERNFKSFLIKAEREYVETAIQLFDGNIADTAHHLGIGRSTLFKRLRNLGLGRQKTTDEREESYVQH